MLSDRTGADFWAFSAFPEFLLRLSDFFWGGRMSFFVIFLGLRQSLLGWNFVPREGV